MLGALIDVVLFTLLRGWLGLPTLAANTFSYSAGIVNNYLLHRRWTFGDARHTAAVQQFGQFVLVSLVALGLNNLLTLLLEAPLAAFVTVPQLSLMLAKLGATAGGAGWNFVANRYWTFNYTPERKAR